MSNNVFVNTGYYYIHPCANSIDFMCQSTIAAVLWKRGKLWTALKNEYHVNVSVCTAVDSVCKCMLAVCLGNRELHVQINNSGAFWKRINF